MIDSVNVHTEHCCYKHGCKYANEQCPVTLGIQSQSYPCEECMIEDGTDFYHHFDTTEPITEDEEWPSGDSIYW